MKVIVVLGVALVIFQVAKANTSEEIAEHATECINKQKLDKKAVAALHNELEVPEDNADYAEFFRCHATKLGTIDESGNVIEERLKEVLQDLWVKRLGDIPDVEAKVQHIVSEAIEKCKDTPKGHSVSQTVVKIRNCLRAEFQKNAPH